MSKKELLVLSIFITVFGSALGIGLAYLIPWIWSLLPLNIVYMG